jgi:hypothetical protein
LEPDASQYLRLPSDCRRFFPLLLLVYLSPFLSFVFFLYRALS